MKILLPNYDCVIGDGEAEVKNSTLYLYQNGKFKDVMYKITYMIYGDDECYYCHRKLRMSPEQNDKSKFFTKISLDHLVPQNFGGLTIPNNLRPCCTECNSKKGNMFEDEFREYLKILSSTSGLGKAGKQIRRLFKESIQYKQELRRYGHVPSLPAEWISNDVDMKCILVNFWLEQCKGGSYQQMVDNVKKYGDILYPLTVTRNGYLVDGFNANLVTTLYDVPKKVAIIENMIFAGFPQVG